MNTESAPVTLTPEDEQKIELGTQAILKESRRQQNFQMKNLGRADRPFTTVAGAMGGGYTALAMLLVSATTPTESPIFADHYVEFASQNLVNASVAIALPMLGGALIGRIFGTRPELLKDGPRRNAALKKIADEHEIQIAGDIAKLSARIWKRREIAGRNTEGVEKSA